jgi:hypothetical protein
MSRAAASPSGKLASRFALAKHARFDSATFKLGQAATRRLTGRVAACGYPGLRLVALLILRRRRDLDQAVDITRRMLDVHERSIRIPQDEVQTREI